MLTQQLVRLQSGLDVSQEVVRSLTTEKDSLHSRCGWLEGTS